MSKLWTIYTERWIDLDSFGSALLFEKKKKCFRIYVWTVPIYYTSSMTSQACLKQWNPVPKWRCSISWCRKNTLHWSKLLFFKLYNSKWKNKKLKSIKRLVRNYFEKYLHTARGKIFEIVARSLFCFLVECEKKLKTSGNCVKNWEKKILRFNLHTVQVLSVLVIGALSNQKHNSRIYVNIV